MDKPQIALDDDGLNVLDPHDTRAVKSHYITLIQEMALRQYLPQGNGRQLAIDVGCGYGRLSSILQQQGWRVVGIDPSARLLTHALAHHTDVGFCQAGLPHLPFAQASVDLILLQNLLRALRLIDKTYLANHVVQFLSPQGTLVVVDNIRANHPDYFDEPELLDFFRQQGLKKTARYPIRAGRWWLLYFIRYGLVPAGWLPRIAAYELDRRRKTTTFPHWQYMNVMYHFRHT